MISMDIDTFLTPLKVVTKLPLVWNSMRSNSLVEYTSATRVEPIAIVDHTIADLPVMSDVTNSATRLFAGYYLQAVAISTNINNVQVVRVLDKLNPSRRPSDGFGNIIALESKKFANGMLPGFSLEGKKHSVRITPAVESNDDDDFHFVETSSRVDQQTSKEVAALATNLSTGIMLNVEITVDDKTVVIPVSLRLITALSQPSVTVQMCAYAGKDKSLSARYNGYKTGELSIKDMIFCVDLIDSHKEALMKDRSGVYGEIVKRRNKNNLSGLLSLNPSVSTASNIMIISADTARDIENELNGKLSDFKLRQRIFDGTYLILMFIVDPRWEQVTIYHRGMKIPTEISFKQLKSQKGGKDVDIGEILKMYQLGNTPTF